MNTYTIEAAKYDNGALTVRGYSETSDGVRDILNLISLPPTLMIVEPCEDCGVIHWEAVIESKWAFRLFFHIDLDQGIFTQSVYDLARLELMCGEDCEPSIEDIEIGNIIYG